MQNSAPDSRSIASIAISASAGPPGGATILLLRVMAMAGSPFSASVARSLRANS
jgi:hypothetical protein